ncbi:AI-2E family transporter [Solirubrobacter phytolaccae]|uniref:AI-2E family transporter n=1 Tax=Solirubrobacter phytolaccae TaxID=1404360 RepID=A0A9X3NEH3_9ACTN|nr:AI-2E family transporter [Solirubrobacter phytolaccae]MDA0183420.1 AI-2E family transporter [Solirubrobacter phytolaccae]
MRPQRVEIVIGVKTLTTILVFGLLVVLAILSLGTLLSIFLAAVLAFGLDPVVTRLVQRGWGRGKAALLVFAGLFASVFTLVLVTVGPVWNQIEEFLRALPEMWEDLQATDWFADVSSTAGFDDKVRDWFADIAKELPDAATALLGAAGGVFGSVLSLVTLTFLSLFLLMERPQITSWLFGFAPPEAEQRWSPVVEESIRAISSSLLGNLAISLVAGTIAGVSAWLLGLPFPVVLAVITGLLDLIPQVGATVAAVILVAVALTVGTGEAVIMLVIQLIYQQVENYIVYPIVYRRAVELTAFTTIVAVLIASSLLGIVGAILAVPFAAVIKILIREASAPRRRRMDALRDGPSVTQSGDVVDAPVGKDGVGVGAGLARGT